MEILPKSTSNRAVLFDLRLRPRLIAVDGLDGTERGYQGRCLGEVIQRISLTGFPAQSVGSSNTDVLDSPCLLVLITGTSQSRQHVITSLIHIESCKSPTKSLFDVGSRLDFQLHCACVFTDRRRLDELEYGIPSDGPYQTKLPPIEDIISSIRIDREGQVRRIRHEEDIDVLEYQIPTREIVQTLKPLEEIIRENFFCLGGNRDHVPTCLCFMLYRVVHSEKFNLAYYMAKRMEWVTKQARLILPYGRPSTSSCTFDQPSLSHVNDDDDNENNEGTSRASTPSPIRYVNSLTNQVPQVFQNPPNIDPNMEPFYTRQTEIINRQVQLRDEQCGGLSDEEGTTTPSPTTTSSTPTPPNAPSKNPSTNQTSSSQDNTSSSFQSKLQISPPSSIEPTSTQHLNHLLENILDVPPRPLNPQPLQSLPSLDITLSLSPITPLENLSSPPSPSPPPPQPPIMGHPLYYNYHGSTDLALYDNESWKDPRDFAKPVKAISLPQDVPSTSDRRLIELENQVQRLMEAHLAPKQPIQVNKITSSCEICSGPYDTQYCMENPEQAFVEYASSRTNEAGEGPEDEGSATIEGLKVEYFDTFLTRSELAYHRYLMSGMIPSLFLRDPIIAEECPSNLKIPCNIGQVHVEKAYIDLNSPLNVMTGMLYNWIMSRKLDPREYTNRGVSNFTGRIKGMHVFTRNFTYVLDFMIVEDISPIIDPRLSQVVLGKPFVEISNMTHDPPEGVVRFTNGTDEIAYKMPHKIEQYNSLSDLEKEHTKSVYLRNKEDKRRGVEYVMSKILGFYKECLKLGPEYLTGVTDEDKVKVNPKVSLYISYPAEFTLGVVVFVFDLQVISDEKKLGSSKEVSLDDSWRMI
ncbi:hypothetical protein Tco_0436460 [Tanacetum coccineum]